MANVRLDNFVYTRESLAEAYALLQEGGLMTLSFADSENSFLINRIYLMLAQVARREPLVFKTGYRDSVVALVVAGSGRTFQTPTALVASQIKMLRPAIREATDDWPYLYLKAPGIPFAYMWVFLALSFAGVIAHALSRRIEGGPLLAHSKSDWPMLLLGAGFMLLETKSITSLSLFYGSTWVVNSVVIAVILFAIFLANLTVMNIPRFPLHLAFVLLALALLANYWLRLEQYVGYGWWTRTLTAALLLGIPIFCAGTIFLRLFQHSVRRDRALGWNLVGAMIGGLLENVSMIIGLNLLNLAAAAFYLAVALIVWRSNLLRERQ